MLISRELVALSWLQSQRAKAGGTAVGGERQTGFSINLQLDVWEHPKIENLLFNTTYHDTHLNSQVRQHRSTASLSHLYCLTENLWLLYFGLDIELVRQVWRADDIRALGTPCAEPVFALLQSCIDNSNYHGGSTSCLGWLAHSGVSHSRPAVLVQAILVVLGV